MRPTNVVLTFAAWGESEEKPERVGERQKLRTIREYIDNVATAMDCTKTMFTAEDSAVSTPRLIASRISMSIIVLVLPPDHMRTVFRCKGNYLDLPHHLALLSVEE
jgi:hypothetical protein